MKQQRERDRQRSKVYAWENRAKLDTSPLTLDDIRKLADEVCSAYRIATVDVSDGRMRRSACYSPGFHEIRMPRFARTKAIALHELAHAVTDTDAESHGPEFMRVYLDLLARWSNTEMRAARKVATEMRIRVASTTKVKAPVPARALSRMRKIDAELAEHRRAIAELQSEYAKLAQLKDGLQRVAAGRADNRGPRELTALLSL